MKTYISIPEEFEAKNLQDLEKQHVDYYCENRDNGVRLYDILVEREFIISTKKPSVIKLQKLLKKIKQKHNAKSDVDDISQALRKGHFTLNVSYYVNRKIVNKLYNRIQDKVNTSLAELGKFGKDGSFKNFE